MAGLLAWAADVVGRRSTSDTDSDSPSSIPLIFSPEQDNYARDLDSRASSLARSIQDLRARIPPSGIAERLPELHAHSVASNAELLSQLNAHSTTREQAQQREIKLQEENAAFERVISDCESKIQERLLEASLLQEKLKEMDTIEADLRAEFANVEAAATSKSEQQAIELATEIRAEAKDKSESALLGELEMKKKEVHSLEEIVQELARTWQEVQDKALKQPSPAQREKALDKQLHGLIEQLAMKQMQAEGLVAEIHTKEKELDRLNSLWKELQNGNAEMNAARNRRSSSGNLYANGVHGHEKLPYHAGGQFLTPQRLRLLRSSFVLYVFLLHVIVFVKISL
ncbi:hypothetical protein Droror1_Dr00016183 [Drosera rotundifolia]